MEPQVEPPSVGNRWQSWRLFAIGVAAYTATLIIVLVGVCTGIAENVLRPEPVDPRLPSSEKSAIFTADAAHYLEIMREGYHYDPRDRSSVAFFPFYPLAARASQSTGVESEVAMLLTANGLLLGAVRVAFPLCR